VLCVVAALLSAAAALAWWSWEPFSVRPNATLVLGVGLGLTLYTGLQCVPVPMAVLSILAPYNAEVWARALAPLHEAAPRWAPLTLDPVATRVEFLKGTAYVLAFLAALRVARRKSGTAFLNLVIVATGVVLAMAALLHPAFNVHRVFGVYEPAESVSARHIAPLLNPNNLAGYLNVALCVILAMTITPEPKIPRPIGAAIVLFLGATQLWVASRGGVVAAAVGAFLVVASSRSGQVDAGRAAMRLSLLSGLGTAVGVSLIVLVGSDEASTELFDKDVSKVALAMAGLRLLWAVPVFGCGRGAFESAFPAFRSGYAGHVTMRYPENVVVQWMTEWGVPVGVAGLVLLAIALRPGAAQARSTSAAGAWAALVALGVQQLCDLGSEVPGLVIAGAVCAAIVVGGSPGRRARFAIERWPRRPAGVAAAAAIVGCAAIARAATTTGRELDQERLAIYAAAIERPRPSGEVHALVRPMMSRHPSEPYFPFAVAYRDAVARDENPVPWIEATLERAPIYAPAHLVLARLLVTRAPAQARLEYRLAMEQMPDLIGTALPEAAPLVRGYEDAIELVPRAKTRVSVLESLAVALDRRLPATAARLDAEAIRLAPGEAGPLLRDAEAKVADLSQPWCRGAARPACVAEALVASGEATDRAPSACRPRVLHARARVAGGDVGGGLDELKASTDEVADRVACLEELFALTTQVGESARANEVLDRVASAGCADDRQCAEQLEWVGRAQESLGEPRKALTSFRRALEWAGRDPGLLAATARLAGQLGMHAEAADWYERLARLQPSESKWAAAAADERTAAIRGGLGLPR
jgi:tetratricopeptide (TPR) repeat protein